MSDPIPPPPFVVTEALSKIYYKDLPSKPPLIATTKPNLFEYPTGPEAYSVLKELRELGDHPLASVWDYGLAERLCRGLNEMCVNWTSIDTVRIVQVGESSDPAIVWIGVEFGTLSFEEGSNVAQYCHMSISSHYHIYDYYMEIRESHVMRQAGNRFLIPSSCPTRLSPLATHTPRPSASRSPPRIGPGSREPAASTSAPVATTRTSTSSLPGTLSSPSTRMTTTLRAHEQGT